MILLINIGIWAPRVSEENGQALTSPRLISISIFQDENKPNEDYTLLLMQYGQFLAHEVSQSFDTSYGFKYIHIYIIFLTVI